MERYIANPGGVLNSTQAEIVGKALERLEKQHGAIKPETLVLVARAKESPLHTLFTWEDTEAARQWRLEEARRIIRSVRVVIQDEGSAEPIMVRAFVSVKAAEDETKFAGQGYVSTARAMRVGFYYEQLLADAKEELVRWRRKYAELKELRAIFILVDADTAGKK